MTDTEFFRMLKSPVVWLTMAATTIVTIQAMVDSLPQWLSITFAVLIAIFGIFGVTARVTPVSDPRAKDGTPLTPAGQ